MAKVKMIDKAIKSAGGISEFNRKFSEYCENDDYFQSHRAELLSSHHGQWVGIYNSELKFSGRSWKRVMDKIKSEGLSDDEVLVQYISSKPRILIL